VRVQVTELHGLSIDVSLPAMVTMENKADYTPLGLSHPATFFHTIVVSGSSKTKMREALEKLRDDIDEALNELMIP
jgi:hypothetical protein